MELEHCLFMVFNDSFLLLPSDYKPFVLLSKSISQVDIMLNSEASLVFSMPRFHSLERLYVS